MLRFVFSIYCPVSRRCHSISSITASLVHMIYGSRCLHLQPLWLPNRLYILSQQRLPSHRAFDSIDESRIERKSYFLAIRPNEGVRLVFIINILACYHYPAHLRMLMRSNCRSNCFNCGHIGESSRLVTEHPSGKPDQPLGLQLLSVDKD